MKTKALLWRACFSWRDTAVRQGAKKSCKVHFYISLKRNMLTEICMKTDLYTTEATTMVTTKKQPRSTPAGSDNRAARHESGQSMAIMIPRSTNNPSGARKVRVSACLEWHPGTLSRFTNLYSIIGCQPPANRHSARPPRCQITMSER